MPLLPPPIPNCGSHTASESTLAQGNNTRQNVLFLTPPPPPPKGIFFFALKWGQKWKIWILSVPALGGRQPDLICMEALGWQNEPPICGRCNLHGNCCTGELSVNAAGSILSAPKGLGSPSPANWAVNVICWLPLGFMLC